ncbi:MAG: IS110 family transposase [Oscillospiraceae bacterium]
MNKYIGFDIDSNKTVACVVENGKNDIYQTIGPDVQSMRQFLLNQKQPGYKIHLAFEISGQAGFIYDLLTDCVDSINVANPTKMTWIYRTAKKNDRIDARKMAVLMSINELPTVYMPDKEVRQWRQMILHRKNIVGKVGQVKNRIRAILKSQGYNKPVNKGSWWKKLNRVWMKNLYDGGMNLWCVQTGNLLDELELLEKQRERITEYLDKYLSNKPGGTLLMSIKGVGPRTAEAVLAYTDDVERFDNYKEYCSYFGLTPKLDESGNCRRIGHISKQGPSVVRWVLCESSWKVIRYNKGMRQFYERVMAGQASRKKIAIVAVCRKLLSIMRAMLLTGELFNERLIDKAEELIVAA